MNWGLLLLWLLMAAGVIWWLWRGASRLSEAQRAWERHVDEAFAIVEDDQEPERCPWCGSVIGPHRCNGGRR